MRELARIQRILDLVVQLWSYEQNLTLGQLLEKWIWTDWIETRGDIFHPEDTQTETRLQEALSKAKTNSTVVELNQLQKDIIKEITDKWPMVPDQRFGQFLSNYAFGHFMSHPPKMMLHQSDEIILNNLRTYSV